MLIHLEYLRSVVILHSNLSFALVIRSDLRWFPSVKDAPNERSIRRYPRCTSRATWCLPNIVWVHLQYILWSCLKYQQLLIDEWHLSSMACRTFASNNICPGTVRICLEKWVHYTAMLSKPWTTLEDSDNEACLAWNSCPNQREI